MRRLRVGSRWFRNLIAAAACGWLLAGPLCTAGETETVLLDEWHAVYIMGSKVGYMHEQVAEDRSGERVTFQSRFHQQLTIARGSVTIRIVMDTTVNEDREGRLISYERRQVQGPLRRVSEGRVEGDELVITSRVGLVAATKRIPAPDGLCSWAQNRLMRQKGYQPGTRYVLKAFVPDFPERDVTMAVTVGGIEPVQVYEVTKRLHRLDAELSILPGMLTSEWVDEGGTVWLARAMLGPGFAIEARRVTRELALAPDDPADILAASFVAADRPIPRPRSLKRLEILLVPTQGSAEKFELPSGPHQQVERTEDGLAVTIRRAQGAPEKSYALPYAGDEHAELLRPNEWLETDDPLVSEMSAKAVNGETDALKAARRIEKYVHDVIEQKGLGLGMATAAETAAQKAGDCTEHAVLAAALARAAGIPSRVVGGLVYVESLLGSGAFGYHMWAEVYVGDWLPLDAALGGHDATHIALVRDDLNGPADLLDLAAGISRFLGKVEVRVVKTEW